MILYFVFSRLWYDVESSEEETVSIVVENKGFETSEACIWVEIKGAPVYKPGMCSPQPPQDPKGYECTLPTPFRRHDNVSITDISKLLAKTRGFTLAVMTQ